MDDAAERIEEGIEGLEKKPADVSDPDASKPDTSKGTSSKDDGKGNPYTGDAMPIAAAGMLVLALGGTLVALRRKNR